MDSVQFIDTAVPVPEPPADRIVIVINRVITCITINIYCFRGVDSVQFLDTAVPVPDPPADLIVIVINEGGKAH